MNKALVKKVLQKILNDSVSDQVPPQIFEVAVLFVDDAAIRTLNCQYRGKDKPTDVLSFSHIEDVELQSFDTLLGELVISVQTLKKQAKEFKVTFEQELKRLLVHGMLHLLGFDHEHVPSGVAAKMRREEKRLRAVV